MQIWLVGSGEGVDVVPFGGAVEQPVDGLLPLGDDIDRHIAGCWKSRSSVNSERITLRRVEYALSSIRQMLGVCRFNATRWGGGGGHL